jgi:transcriptional regulator with XRE-family HTH domain
LRRRLGITQEQLAAGLGLDEETVFEFELGRRRASRRVQRLIDEFVAERGGS